VVKDSKPRRGSMAYYPRKRAKSIVARIRSWPKIEEVKPLGFAGYKVGMTHVILIEDNPNSPYYGKEVAKAVTILETPPLYVCGIRAYTKTPYGLKCLCEVWGKDLPKDLERAFTVPKNPVEEHEENMKKFLSMKEEFNEIRLIVCTQPRRAGIHKKKPEILEIPVGGSIEDALKYALEKLGKEINVREFISPGDLVDVISITKGKGFAGVIKRYGVKIMPRWHKHRKGSRRIGSVGPTKPHVMFTTPRPGQLGFHQRTEYNKRVLMIGDDPANINPPSGFKHYGVIKSQYVILEGSVPGPTKRLVRLRLPIRPPPRLHKAEPNITYIGVTTRTPGG